MKKILTLLLSTVVSISTYAQHRYPVDNVTDYSKILSTTNGKLRIGTRASAPLPCTGKTNIPVILVQFADKAFISDTIWDKTITHSDANVNVFYDKFCNGSDVTEDYRYTIGSLGTVKQYFIDQSDSLFEPNFTVIGPVTLSQGYAYYGKDSSSSSKDTKLSEFYTEAIKLATDLGTDWTQFDYNNDGITDFVFFIFAGEGQNAYGYMDKDKEHSTLIWPQERTGTTTVGGRKFGGYGCTCELFMSNVLSTDGIGTMCHELSHGLGLPDFYDYSYNSFGLDYYDVMDSGCYCLISRSPVSYSSYERDFMGWRKMETIDITKQQTITIEPIEKGGKGYKIVNPNNANEYFFIDNRQYLGFDSYFAYQTKSDMVKYGQVNGLLIYHVNYVQSKWTSNSVNTGTQYFTILAADGKLISSIEGYTVDYFNSLRGDTYPGLLNVTSISSDKFACASGNNIPVEITRIVQNDDKSVTIDINGGEQTAIADVVDENSANANDSAIYDLSGRRIEKPSRGVYIKNGKKYFVK